MAPIPASANGLGEVQELENVAVRDIALAFMAGILDKYNEHLLAPTANWEVCSALSRLLLTFTYPAVHELTACLLCEMADEHDRLV